VRFFKEHIDPFCHCGSFSSDISSGFLGPYIDCQYRLTLFWVISSIKDNLGSSEVQVGLGLECFIVGVDFFGFFGVFQVWISLSTYLELEIKFLRLVWS